MQPAGQTGKWAGGLVVGFLLLQSGASMLAGEQDVAVNYLFYVAAPLLAMLACSRRAWQSDPGPVRTGWTLLAAAMLLWATGMALSAWQELSGLIPSQSTYFSDFAFFIYGAPVLLAISSVTSARSSRTMQWLDAIQVLLAAYLAYTAIFSVSPFERRSAEPMSMLLLVTTYNVENLLLAICATLRLLAHPAQSEEGRLFLPLTRFLWLYALCAGLYNTLLMVYQPTDLAALVGAAMPLVLRLLELLPSLAFVVLAALASMPTSTNERPGGKRRQQLTLLIDNFGPIFFTASLLGLGFVIIREHYYLATGALLVALAIHATRSAILQRRYIESEQALRSALDQLEKMALTDALTKVANRRCFDQTLQQEWQRHARGGEALALLIVDIDFFKSLNDTFGHPYGDACLVKVAAALQSALPRSNDLVARYGGEEFAAILPGTDIAGAHAVAQKMQEAIAAAAIVQAPARGGLATASIGVAVTLGGHFTPEQLLASADQALYRAKQNGRNRIELNVLGDPATLTLVAGVQ